MLPGSGTSLISRLINRPSSSFGTARFAARYVSGFAKGGWRPGAAPKAIEPWLKQTIQTPTAKRSLKAEGSWLAKALAKEPPSSDWVSHRVVEARKHSWWMFRRGDSDVRQWPGGANARDEWMARHAIPSMATTLLENGCAFLPETYARLRATINSGSITYGYEQKYGLDPSIVADSSKLYAAPKKGTAVALGNNMIRTDTEIVEIELPDGGRIWGIRNVVTPDHAFSGNLTWWRGYDGDGRPITIVYGGGNDVIPLLQPYLNVYGGEYLMAQSNDVWDALCRPKNADLRDADLARVTWMQDLRNKIWIELPPSTQNVRLLLDLVDGISAPLKMLKAPAKFVDRILGREIPDKEYWEYEEVLEKAFKDAQGSGSTAAFGISDPQEAARIGELIAQDFSGQMVEDTYTAFAKVVDQLNADLRTVVPSDAMEDVVRKVLTTREDLKGADPAAAFESLQALSSDLRKLDYARNDEFRANEVRMLTMVDEAAQRLAGISRTVEAVDNAASGKDRADPVDPIDDPIEERVDRPDRPDRPGGEGR